MQYRPELEVAERAAVAAGDTILAHYVRGEIAVDTKADQSPVTQADRDANARIVELVGRGFPDDAILSEELPDDQRRLAARRVWIIDPLDGTRDFVARTGQFSVHVALAVDGEAVVGAVYQPVAAVLYAASRGGGAWEVRGGERRRIKVSTTAMLADARIGVSRLNAAGRLGACLAAAGLTGNAVAMGASVKHMALAAGTLDAVITLGPGEQDWDTCAPEVVIREAGGRYTHVDGTPFRYNQADVGHPLGSIASNGACHSALVSLVHPYLEAR